MAFQLESELDNTGLTGDYWRLAEVHVTDRGVVADYLLYSSQADRTNNKNPMGRNVQMVFKTGDHPITELDVDTVDTTLVTNTNEEDWYYRFLKHCVYLHTKNVIAAAHAKVVANQELILESETQAHRLYGAVDIL